MSWALKTNWIISQFHGIHFVFIYPKNSSFHNVLFIYIILRTFSPYLPATVFKIFDHVMFPFILQSPPVCDAAAFGLRLRQRHIMQWGKLSSQMHPLLPRKWADSDHQHRFGRARRTRRPRPNHQVTNSTWMSDSHNHRPALVSHCQTRKPQQTDNNTTP